MLVTPALRAAEARAASMVAGPGPGRVTEAAPGRFPTTGPDPPVPLSSAGCDGVGGIISVDPGA